MSNTVSNKGEAIAVQGHKTRRAALRALVGASALAIPAIGASASISSALGDPILAAIERHRAAYEAVLASRFAIDDMIHTPEGRKVSQAEWEAFERAHENEDAAFGQLLKGAPETSAGMRAIIAHLVSLDDGRLPEKMRRLLALMLKSRVLAS
jgi:hypothetical protein